MTVNDGGQDVCLKVPSESVSHSWPSMTVAKMCAQKCPRRLPLRDVIAATFVCSQAFREYGRAAAIASPPTLQESIRESPSHARIPWRPANAAGCVYHLTKRLVHLMRIRLRRLSQLTQKAQPKHSLQPLLPPWRPLWQPPSSLEWPPELQPPTWPFARQHRRPGGRPCCAHFCGRS